MYICLYRKQIAITSSLTVPWLIERILLRKSSTVFVFGEEMIIKLICNKNSETLRIIHLVIYYDNA